MQLQLMALYQTEELLQYYDFYERMEENYFSEDKERESGKEELQYIYPLTQIHKIPNEKSIRIQFKLLIFLSQIQNILTIEKLYEKAKEASHSEKFEQSITMEQFEKLIKQTNDWLTTVKEVIETEKNNKVKNEILRKIDIFAIPEEINDNVLSSLTDTQKEGIKLLKTYLSKEEYLDSDMIQNKIFIIANNDLGLPPRKMFEAIYQVILGKESGPRLGSFLSLLDKQWLLERLNF